MTSHSTRAEGLGRGTLDDETVALVAALHREPKVDGQRRSQRDIAKEAKRLGHPISHSAVGKILAELHAETIGAATSQVREKIATALDVNVERIAEMAELLANIARNGKLPGPTRYDDDGNEIGASGAQIVSAAREAIVGSVQLMSAVGVSDGNALTSEEAAAKIRAVYDLGSEDDEEADRGSRPAQAVPTPLA
jgi:hypothetical protein